MKLFATFLMIYYSLSLKAQEDFSWWNDKHNWDGHTSWVQYMTMSTSYMGPNALPVPHVMTGQIDSLAQLEFLMDIYQGKGDTTIDFFLRGYCPLYENRFAVSINVIPYEWFEMDTITRDERAARTQSGKGGAGGDIYFITDFLLIRENTNTPGICFQAAFRTASGTNLSNARYTDGPGYYFNINAGKNYPFRLFRQLFIRPYLMAGFYAYQTYDIQHPQNDCLLYGAGIDIFRPLTYSDAFTLSQSIGGYNGYLNIGDRPVVYRANLSIQYTNFDFKIGFQTGIRDFHYKCFSLGAIYHLNAGRLFKKK